MDKIKTMANNYRVGDNFEYEGVVYTIVDRVGKFISASCKNELYSFFYDSKTDKIYPTIFEKLIKYL